MTPREQGSPVFGCEILTTAKTSMADAPVSPDAKEKKYENAKKAVNEMCEAVNKAVVELSRLQSLDDDAAVRAASRKIAKIAGEQAHRTGCSIMKKVRMIKLQKVMKNPMTSTSGTEEEKKKLAKKLTLELVFMDLVDIARRGPNKETREKKQEETKKTIAHPWTQKDKLGSGGFGTVYSAVDKNGFEFAVKNVPRAGIAEQLIREEVKLLGKLNHKNIVKFYGCAGDKEHIYMFIELLEGSIFDNMKKTGQPVSENLAKKYTIDIMCGLVYLHKNGVIHRDLKCANVLLDSEGNAKLADMGLSKVHQQETLLDESVNERAGTMCYMSPEVLTGRQGGKRSDVWGVGCCVYEMLTTMPPFLKELSPILVGLFLPRMIVSCEHRNLIPKQANFSPALKNFLLRIFVKIEERPYAEALANDPWIQQS